MQCLERVKTNSLDYKQIWNHNVNRTSIFDGNRLWCNIKSSVYPFSCILAPFYSRFLAYLKRASISCYVFSDWIKFEEKYGQFINEETESFERITLLLWKTFFGKSFSIDGSFFCYCLRKLYRKIFSQPHSWEMTKYVDLLFLIS